jgi:uncharacterized membrane protein
MFPHREPPFHTDWWSVERLVPILLMLVLIAVVVWAVVRFSRQPRVAPAGVDTGPDRSALSAVGDPVDLVRQRYARGELDRETFLQTVQDLSPRNGEVSVEPPVTDPPPTDAA